MFLPGGWVDSRKISPDGTQNPFISVEFGGNLLRTYVPRAMFVGASAYAVPELKLERMEGAPYVGAFPTP